MQLLRWLVTFVGGSMILPVLAGFFVDYAKMSDAYKKPDQTLGTIWQLVLALWSNSYFTHAACAMGGIALGMWLDWLFRRFDRSHATALEVIGYEYLNLSHDVARAQGGFRSEWPENIGHLMPNFLSTFTKAKKRKILIPSENIFDEKDPGALINYLQIVGKFLSERQFKEAREAAKALANKYT